MLERVLQHILKAVDENTMYGVSALTTDRCGTPHVNWPPVIVNLDSELLTLPFGPKDQPGFHAHTFNLVKIICLPS